MKWICTVCKYEHEGDAPPDVCPVCKQPKEKFELKKEEETEKTDAKKADVEAVVEEKEAPAKEKEDSSEENKTQGRKWYCTVCRYIHEGDSPPDICPVCKKPWTAFVPHVDGQEHPRVVPSKPPAAATSAASPGKSDRWRCVVCNYIHEGDEPPDVCPICGKLKDAFVPETKSPVHHHRGISGLIEKLHAHPVSAHFPNGAMPMALLAWVAYLILGFSYLERMSLLLMLIAVAAVPVTFFTGWSDAKHRFGTTITGVFPEKKRLSWVLVVLSATIAGWRLYLGFFNVPQNTVEIAIFTGLLIACSGVVARLGMLGGKLVFGH